MRSIGFCLSFVRISAGKSSTPRIVKRNNSYNGSFFTSMSLSTNSIWIFYFYACHRPSRPFVLLMSKCFQIRPHFPRSKSFIYCNQTISIQQATYHVILSYISTSINRQTIRRKLFHLLSCSSNYSIILFRLSIQPI